MFTERRNTRLGSAILSLFVTAGTISALQAASPAGLAAGRMLFEKQWVATNPAIQSDGLGPLFNGQSCVACHHQGGVGGGGEARFNARSIGIETIHVSPGPSQDNLAKLVGSFHPGFVGDGNSVVTAMPLPHHGGTPLFVNSRTAMLSQLASLSDSSGGPMDAAEVRQENARPIRYQQTMGGFRINLQARVFHRNTTALFGAGLIDAVPAEAMKEQMRLQERHPEISGRPATLLKGQIGKFGWRANVPTLREFNDQACANELGLKTRSHDQPADATAPGYHNPRYDIDDEQVEAMHQFVAALPAPTRSYPESSEQRQYVQQGEQLFSSVGCSVCHTPTLGPAQGIYSDLLLHDMGYELRDLNGADPYIIRSTVAGRSTPVVSVTSTTTDTRSMSYYGSVSTVTTVSKGPGGMAQSGGGAAAGKRQVRFAADLKFVTPTYPETTMRFIPLDSKEEWTSEHTKGEFVETRRRTKIRHQVYVRQTIEPTPVTQEWRTAPLWGLRDSAPYMHDGRAGTVLEAIALHEGEAAGTRDRFLNLSVDQREAILAFLDTMVAPPTAPQQLQ